MISAITEAEHILTRHMVRLRVGPWGIISIVILPIHDHRRTALQFELFSSHRERGMSDVATTVLRETLITIIFTPHHCSEAQTLFAGNLLLHVHIRL